MSNTIYQHVKKSIALVLAATLFLGLVRFALAKDDVDELEEEIANRKSQIELINKQIEDHRSKLEQYSTETASLLNDVAMIENQVAIANLDVSVTQAQIETQQLELKILDEQIRDQESKLNSQKEMLGEMLFALHRKSDVDLIQVLFGAEDFNALFTEIEQIESINTDLHGALEATSETKEHLDENKRIQEDHLQNLVELETRLKSSIAKLESQQAAKDTLLAASQESEAKYRVLMSELRQERQFITNEIARIQDDIDQRLIESDNGDQLEAGVMSWPVSGGIITAIFHDPSYPYRHLFEHSGLDIAVPSGTSIRAAAPGIVAWARTGNSYGNYVMIIHPGGYATLYAHMSRLDVTADQFVARGQQIGLSGNTGLSTGPHLHFEVRLNGIPVNPQTYLVGR